MTHYAGLLHLGYELIGVKRFATHYLYNMIFHVGRLRHGDVGSHTFGATKIEMGDKMENSHKSV